MAKTVATTMCMMIISTLLTHNCALVTHPDWTLDQLFTAKLLTFIMKMMIPTFHQTFTHVDPTVPMRTVDAFASTKDVTT